METFTEYKRKLCTSFQRQIPHLIFVCPVHSVFCVDDSHGLVTRADYDSRLQFELKLASYFLHWNDVIFGCLLIWVTLKL